MNHNKKEIYDNIRCLYNLYLTGKLPELEKHEVNPGLPLDSKENYLYFTLPCALNYQRNSPAMWASALATYTDPETNYIFSPEKLIKRDSFDDLQKHMAKHKLALKKNKDVSAWATLSQTFYNHYEGNPKNLVIESNYSVAKMIKILQKDKKDCFPYLGGIKLSNYFIFILSRFTDAKFIDMRNYL